MAAKKFGIEEFDGFYRVCVPRDKSQKRGEVRAWANLNTTTLVHKVNRSVTKFPMPEGSDYRYNRLPCWLASFSRFDEALLFYWTWS